MKKRIISAFLSVVMLLTLLPTVALAEDTGPISLSLSYDDSLCSVRIYDGHTQGAETQTVFVTGNGQTATAPSGSWLIFEISGIKDGYRIGSVMLEDGNAQTNDDRTDGFVDGAYGGLSISNATRNYAMTVVIEEIPSSLPTISSVTLYTDLDGTQLATDTNYTAEDTDARLYGIATYSDGESYPNYYTTGQWQYSTDGTTWHDTATWGSNRYDFWPGWEYHEELNFLTASYDIRLCATPRDLYATGDEIYSNVIHINGGAGAGGTGGADTHTNDATLYVGGVQLAKNGAVTSNTYPNASYNADTNTLTLSGVNITDYYTVPNELYLKTEWATDVRTGIYYSGSKTLNIVLEQDTNNYIALSPSYDSDTTDDNDYTGYLYAVGLFAAGDVNIETDVYAQLNFEGATLSTADTHFDDKADERSVKAYSIFVQGDLVCRGNVNLSENYNSFTATSGGTSLTAQNDAPFTVFVRDNLETRELEYQSPTLDCQRIFAGAHLFIGEGGTVTAESAEAGVMLELRDGTATIQNLLGTAVSVYGGDSTVGTLTVNQMEVDTLSVTGANAKLVVEDCKTNDAVEGYVTVNEQANFSAGTVEITSSGIRTGLNSTGTVTISGTANVTVNMTGSYATAISSTGGVSVSGSPTVSLTGFTGISSGNYSTLSPSAGDVTIGGGTVTMTCGNTGINLLRGNLTVTGGDTTITAKNAVWLYSALQTGSGHLTVSGGVLRLNGTQAAVLWSDNSDVTDASVIPTPTISVVTNPAISVASKVTGTGADASLMAAYAASGTTVLEVDDTMAVTNALKSITFGSSACQNGHTVVSDPAVAATCTKTGLTAGSHCSVCNAVLTAQTVIPSLGHNYQMIETAPTCTERGYTTYTCTRCSDSYVGDYIAALGHSYAYAADGAVITETCENGCGHSATATISVTGSHTYTGTAQTPATAAYSTDWAGGEAAPSYTNNTDAGNATASITVGGQTASTTFVIAPADYIVTPSATSGTITVGSSAGPNLTATATGVNSEAVSGTLSKWYSNAACTQLVSSFAGYAVGTHTIYWKFVSTDSNYTSTPKTGSYTLTVAEGAEQTLTWSGAAGGLSTIYGTPINGKTATATEADHGAITYSSSNTNVATVNSATGALTIVGAGDTTITATASAVTGKYRETSITYPLTVSKKSVTVTVTPATRKFGESNPTFAATVPAGALVGSDSVADLGLGLSTTATATSNAGSYDVTGDGSYNANYNVTVVGANALTVTKANARTLADLTVSQKYTVTSQQSKSVAGLMPTDAGTLTYAKGSSEAIVNVTDWAVDSTTGNVTFTLSGGAGNTVTLPVTICSTNYEDSTVKMVITLTDKDVPTVSANDITAAYTGNAVAASDITGTATFGGNAVSGVWSWKDATAVTAVADSGTKTVVFTPNDTNTYATVETTLTLTINKATPTGAPKYTAISEANKTLSDAALTAEGGTLSITGSVKWVDANGNDLANTTVVAANTAYRWLFTPADSANYNTLSGSVTLYRASTGGGGGGSVSTPTTTTPEVSTGSGSATATVDVTGKTSGSTTTATVTESEVTGAITAAVEAAGTGTAAVEIKVDTPANADSLKVSLPSTAMDALADSKAETLTITSGVGEIAISSEAAASIAQQAGTAGVTVTISKVDTEKTLNERQQAAIGDAPVYDLSVTAGGKYISEFDGGLMTVTLPYTLKSGEDPAGVVVWYMDENGNIEKLRAMYDIKTKTVVFTTNHFSLYVVGYDEIAAMANPFTDVADSAYYYDAVKWAVYQSITSGTTTTTFAPNATCTRAQTVTFLWRAMGSPEPTTTVNPFTDVTADAYYYKAVLWAVEKGITVGTSATTFAPDATVTRAQVATFLWRTAGTPAATTASTFTDVPSDAYYAVAVIWAAEKGITSGTGATTFSPAKDCTRAQIVTFLYRQLSR